MSNKVRIHPEYLRYDWDHNVLLPYERSFLPDAIIDRLKSALWPQIQKLKWLPTQNTAYNAPSTLSQTFNRDIVTETMNFINARFPSIFKGAIGEAFSNKQIDIKQSQGKIGSGYCDSNGTVAWTKDGSLNDIIYFLHEMGHHLAIRQSNHLTPWNITEWQSYFLHHAGYDYLIDKNPKQAEAYKTHRHLELLSGLKDYQQACSSPNPSSSDLHRIHYHASAMFIGLALHSQYQKAGSQTQRSMINALYNQGKEATPETILDQFNLLDKGKLEEEITTNLTRIGFDASKNISPQHPTRAVS